MEESGRVEQRAPLRHVSDLELEIGLKRLRPCKKKANSVIDALPNRENKFYDI